MLMRNPIHKNSGVYGKTPLPSQLDHGEIGVNWNADDPFLSIKDSSGYIRRMTSEGTPGTQSGSSAEPKSFYVSSEGVGTNSGKSPAEAFSSI